MALMAASAICGSAVTGSDGEALGTITEVMIESDSGRIDYAVLSYGGVLGVGEKLFAVPWTQFTIEAADGRFLLDAQASALADADGIGKDAWPTEARPDWIA